MQSHGPSKLFSRSLFLRRALACGLAALLLPGCGSGDGGGPTPVRVSPDTVTVNPSASANFSALGPDNTAMPVTWSVVEANGGTVTAQGVYTAPAIAGTYHVRATSVADTTQSATATVNVPLLLSVDPTARTLTLGESQQFNATVLGAANTGVTWRVQEAGGGAISTTGLYTAPNTPGTYHVIATSQADTARTVTATITVQAGSASGTIQ
jgi:hypothetical protein